MVNHIEGLSFLKRKYDLHNTPEVYAAVRRTEKLTGQRVPQKPVYPIQNYLDRFHQSSTGAIKRVLLSRFATNIGEFPESYWGLTERIIRERGEQADWDNFTPEQKLAGKKIIAQNLIHDQRTSLEA